MKRIILISLVSLVCLCVSVVSFAGDKLINYQGVLMDANGQGKNGAFDMTFALYTIDAGGVAVWSETKSVVVENGLFNTKLGDTSPLTDVPFDTQYWIGASVGRSPELPRQKLTSAPYALGSIDNFIVNGNLGIGTASPSGPLHIVSNDHWGEWPHHMINFETSDPSAHVGINLNVSGDWRTTGIFLSVNNTVDWFIGRPYLSWNSHDFDICEDGDYLVGQWANGTSRVTVKKGTGNVGIGTRDPGTYKLYVNGTAYKSDGYAFWSTSSDIRLKKNVQPLKGALDKMSSLRGVTFEWKEPEKHANLTGIQMGMIAQEVEKVFPQWIDTNQNGYKDLTLRGFEALAVEAIKELKAENEALKARIERLEGGLSTAK